MAKLDGAGLYEPRDPFRNMLLGCTLHHRPSLACGSWYRMCPFKCSNTWGLSQWDTRSIRDSRAGRVRVSSFCYCGSEKFFQHLASTLTPCLHFGMLAFVIELLQKHRLRGTGPASDLSDTSINLGCCSQLVWKYFKSAYAASVPAIKGLMI